MLLLLLLQLLLPLFVLLQHYYHYYYYYFQDYNIGLEEMMEYMYATRRADERQSARSSSHGVVIGKFF
jgi:hypothetical protein